MVLGKLLILLTSAPAYADNVLDPKFFEYKSNTVIGRIVEFSFGWNKKLNDDQKQAYHQSLVHALEYAENNQRVDWYHSDAGGFSKPVMTWPSNGGYCRRIHTQAIAFGKQKTMSFTACHNSSTNSWTWYRDK